MKVNLERNSMIHKISGHNFHGDYAYTLRGAKAGFILSAKQAAKAKKATCTYAGCQCAGGYGNGPDAFTARIKQVDFDSFELIPAYVTALHKA